MVRRRRFEESSIPPNAWVVLDSDFLYAIHSRENALREHYAALLERALLGQLRFVSICPYAIFEFVAQLALGKERVRGFEGVAGLVIADESLRRAATLTLKLVEELRRRLAIHRYKLAMWLCSSNPRSDVCRDVSEGLQLIAPRVGIEEIARDSEVAMKLSEKAEKSSGRKPSVWRALVGAFVYRVSRGCRDPVFVVSPDSIYEDMGVPWIDVRSLRRRGVAVLPRVTQ